MPWSDTLLTSLWCVLRLFLGCATCEANQEVFCWALKLAFRCVSLGPLRRAPRPNLVAPCDWFGDTRRYKAICHWCLTLLELKAHERGHIANQGQLPPILGLPQLSIRP